MAGYGYLNRGYTGYTDDRSKKTYGESGYFDPASRPTITSTDKIVEYDRPPMEPVKDYGYTDDKWRGPSSPIRNRPQRVEEFISNVQVEPNQPYSGNGTGYKMEQALGYVQGVREEYKNEIIVFPVATAVAQPWSGTAPVSTVPRRETYTPNPVSRYGNFNLSSRRYREAATK